MKSDIPTRKIPRPLVVIFELGLAAITIIGTAQAQTQVGIGSDHFAAGVDSAGSRMNIENVDDTFPTLPAGTYEVTDFEYSTTATVAEIQPFLAVNTGGDDYSVIWAGPTEESPGTDDIVSTPYAPGTQQFTLDSSAEVYAGFNAAGPNVKFGDGLTDHNNPADFDITPGSDITAWTNPDLARSYAFEINVRPGTSDIEDITLVPAVSFPTDDDAAVLSSTAAGTAVGSLRGLNEFGNPFGGLEFTLVAGEGDSNNGLYSIGGANDDQLLVNASLAGLNNIVHSVRIFTEGDGGTFEKAVTFIVKLDSDNDGLIDDWETMFGSLGDFAAGGDHDSDSLDDDVEFGLGLNPDNPDTDGDGFNDDVELASNSDPTDPASRPNFKLMIGIGSDHPAGGVDSAGSRMNIENFDDTFPTLSAGTYDVSDFEYSTSADIAEIQPFLAVSIADDEYSVIWVGPTEESPGTDDIVTTSYEPGSQQFTLDDSEDVYAGFNAAGPIVKFGDGLTDHANPADFEIEPSSEIFGFGHANLARSYAFAINVLPSTSDVENIVLDAAVAFPDADDAVVLSSSVIGSPVGRLIGLNEFGSPVAGLEFALVAGEGDSNNGIYSIGGPDGDQLLVSASLSGLDDVVHSVRVLAEGDGGTFEKAVTFTVKLDSDNDGLIDDWETMFGALGDFATGGDHDADGLDDDVEFGLGFNPDDPDADDDGSLDGDEIANGTDPAKPDTDGDGLNDGDEATAMSDPLVTDTDGDGISDGDEVSNANGFVTDPTRPDTDGDGFDDDVELAANSDPTNAASQPSFEGLIAIGIGTELPGTGVDSAGSRMNIENSDETFPTLPAGTYNVKDFTYSAGTDVEDLQPFLAANTGGDEYIVLWAGPAEPASGSDDITTVAYDAGTEQFTLASPTAVYAGFNAAGPNVKFGDGGPTDHNNPADFSITAESEITAWTNPNLGRSYRFAINVEPAITTNFQVTEIIHAGGESPSLTLTFNSRPGATYAVFASTTLMPDGEPGGWVELNDNVMSEGTETTYIDTDAVASGSQTFYQFRETP